MRPLVKLNVGGRPLQVLARTLARYPHTPLAVAVDTHFTHLDQAAAAAAAAATAAAASGSPVPPPTPATAPVLFDRPPLAGLCATTADGELFVDADPDAFESVLGFLRTGAVVLPVDSEPQRAAVVWLLGRLQLTEHAFPPVVTDAGREAASEEGGGGGEAEAAPAEKTTLPDIIVVQMNDHMTHEQGVKRHAINVTFGSDGFHVKRLCKAVRRDLKTQLSSTFWQMYQTNERAAFFISTKVNSGTADLLTTSLSQRVVQHTESMGYSLVSSYVTLSPDAVHTSVRMFIHYMIFRRSRTPTLEASDEDKFLVVDEGTSLLADRTADDGGGEGSGGGAYCNIEPPHDGPTLRPPAPETVPPGQRVGKIWE